MPAAPATIDPPHEERSDAMSRTRRALLGAGPAAMVTAVGGGPLTARTAAPTAASQPQTRQLPLVLVPVLTHEFAAILPYLTPAFAPGGLLAGKAVFAFLPHHLTAYAGDTLELTGYNPADDPHTLTVPALPQSVAIPGGHVAKLTLRDLVPGIYQFRCSVAEHMPFMWGQLVVLPPPA
jgi:hypothetical protein